MRSFEGERKKNDRFKIRRLKKMSANNDGSIDEDRTRFSFPIQISKQLIGVFKRFKRGSIRKPGNTQAIGWRIFLNLFSVYPKRKLMHFWAEIQNFSSIGLGIVIFRVSLSSGGPMRWRTNGISMFLRKNDPMYRCLV